MNDFFFYFSEKYMYKQESKNEIRKGIGKHYDIKRRETTNKEMEESGVCY